jgi:hypothetical protein
MSFNGFVVLSCKVFFGFSDSPMAESDLGPFIADNSTPSPRKRSPTAEFLADNSTPSPRKQSPTAEFRERVDYLEDDRQQYESALVGEFKI